MLKKLFALIMVSFILFVAGCSSNDTSSSAEEEGTASNKKW